MGHKKGFRNTEESIRRMKKTKKERFNRLGYVNSPDTRKKLSEAWKKKLRL